jgi:hypothetical protein
VKREFFVDGPKVMSNTNISVPGQTVSQYQDVFAAVPLKFFCDFKIKE